MLSSCCRCLSVNDSSSFISVVRVWANVVVYMSTVLLLKVKYSGYINVVLLVTLPTAHHHHHHHHRNENIL